MLKLPYEKLIQDMAKRTGLHSDNVRRVLFHLPDALEDCLRVGVLVRTPLGVFYKIETESRSFVTSNGDVSMTAVKRIIKLRPGHRLWRKDKPTCPQ